MAQPSVQGRFIWEGLMTEDPAGATAFYSKVLGWRTEPWAVDPTYTIFAAKSGPVAGMSRLTDALREQGVQGHWLGFIGADDVDAMVASAEKLGARVIRPASDIDQVGRFAILADPQGAAFALFKPLQSSAPAGVPKPGEFSWQELATTDDQEAFKFYGGLFGWQLMERMDMGAMGFYLIFGSDGVQRGGMYQLSPPALGPHWLPYASVADADKAAAATTKAGGRVLNGPMNVPGGGRIAQLADPSGVAFAVHAMGKSTAAPPPPKPAARKVARKAVKKKAAAKKATRKATRKPAKKAAKKATRKPAKKKVGRKKVAARRASSARKSVRPAAKKAKRAPGKARRKQ
jgi:predicted enzyme related to lactoylglutathione lyase